MTDGQLKALGAPGTHGQGNMEVSMDLQLVFPHEAHGPYLAGLVESTQGTVCLRTYEDGAPGTYGQGSCDFSMDILEVTKHDAYAEGETLPTGQVAFVSAPMVVKELEVVPGGEDVCAAGVAMPSARAPGEGRGAGGQTHGEGVTEEATAADVGQVGLLHLHTHATENATTTLLASTPSTWRQFVFPGTPGTL